MKKKNNNLESFNASNVITQRLLENAIEQRIGNFSGLEPEREEFINPLLLMPGTEADKVVTLYGISFSEYIKPKITDKYARVIIHEFTFLERPIGNAFAQVLNKYQNHINFIVNEEKGYDIIEPNMDGAWFNDKLGVVIMPLKITRIYQYRVPKRNLSEQNLKLAAEQIKEEEIGSLFVGVIPGRLEERELLALHYLGKISDNLDAYTQGLENSSSPQIKQIEEMIHPINPTTILSPQHKKSSWEFDRMTGQKVWLSTIHYDIHYNCRRSNCSFCFNPEINPERNQFHDAEALDERLRKATLDYLQGMKTNLDILSNLILSTFILADFGDYAEGRSASTTATASLEDRIKELEKFGENLESLLGSSSDSADSENS
jgi:hypothetical protein